MKYSKENTDKHRGLEAHRQELKLNAVLNRKKIIAPIYTTAVAVRRSKPGEKEIS